MVTQQTRLSAVNGRAFSMAVAAILVIAVGIFLFAWISTASSNAPSTPTQSAPSYAPAYQGHVRPLHVS